MCLSQKVGGLSTSDLAMGIVESFCDQKKCLTNQPSNPFSP